jgi:FkbM family methyltransferase
MAPRIIHSAIRRIAGRLSFETALQVSKILLHAQGFGSGADPRKSGERRVFSLLNNDQPILFDVGGHLGGYTAAFLEKFPGGQAYLFEPSAAHMKIARENLSAYSSVCYLPYALSDRDGDAILYKNSTISLVASLTRRRLDHYSVAMDITETIECKTIDGIMSDLAVPSIDLLKIDVEGHELAVLRGAQATINAGRVPIIQFEFGGSHLDTRTTFQDFFYFFGDRNYWLYIIRPRGDLVRIAKYEEALEQYQTSNFVAILKDCRT